MWLFCFSKSDVDVMYNRLLERTKTWHNISLSELVSIEFLKSYPSGILIKCPICQLTFISVDLYI